MANSDIGDFLQRESAAGFVLIGAAAAALLLANSPLGVAYSGLLSGPIAISVGKFVLPKTVIH
ncbi:MAG: Na+/H+ antiporter NhaA [Rhodospirillaceae bacterium]